MKILFLTLLDFNSFFDRNIYTDLLREFIKNNHDVYCISPTERRMKKTTEIKENGHLLKLRIGDIQKTSIIKKGISTLMLERHFKLGIKKFFSNIKFDLILYSTPPITFTGVVKYVKNRDKAKTYLMLKDIFPQNAIDLGMMRKTGIKGFLYRFFRKKEKELYALSDYIGCMSQANVKYIIEHNPEISVDKVEVCPNSIEVCDVGLSEKERMEFRDKYGIPQDKRVFVYGGNLGKPQNIPFIIECLKKCAELPNIYFVIAGSGTDRYLLEKYVYEENPSHVKLLEQLPKDEYDKMIACCDVGLIFLDLRFTIPNFPSRLLSYMQVNLPVLACTDTNTDIGKVIVDGGFGWWCESTNSDNLYDAIAQISQIDIVEKKNSREYLNTFYSVQSTYAKCFANIVG